MGVLPQIYIFVLTVFVVGDYMYIKLKEHWGGLGALGSTGNVYPMLIFEEK